LSPPTTRSRSREQHCARASVRRHLHTRYVIASRTRTVVCLPLGRTRRGAFVVLVQMHSARSPHIGRRTLLSTWAPLGFLISAVFSDLLRRTFPTNLLSRKNHLIIFRSGKLKTSMSRRVRAREESPPSHVPSARAANRFEICGLGSTRASLSLAIESHRSPRRFSTSLSQVIHRARGELIARRVRRGKSNPF